MFQPSTDTITNPYWTRHELYAEIVCLQLATYLVRAGVCPNLPMFFAYFPCGSCSFANENIINKYNKTETQKTKTSASPRQSPRIAASSKTTHTKRACILMLNEFASGGDFSNWCEQSRSLEEWMNAYFQIFMGLAAIQKYYNMTHYDLHWGNVLVHNVPAGGCWKYKLNGKTYYCPNLGFVFVLWDFGYAKIPGRIEITRTRYLCEKIKKDFPDDTTVDYSNIGAAPLWTHRDYTNVTVPIQMLASFQDIIGQQLPLKTLIEELFYIYLEKLPSVIRSYSMDKAISIPAEYQKYLHY